MEDEYEPTENEEFMMRIKKDNNKITQKEALEFMLDRLDKEQNNVMQNSSIVLMNLVTNKVRKIIENVSEEDVNIILNDMFSVSEAYKQLGNSIGICYQLAKFNDEFDCWKYEDGKKIGIWIEHRLTREKEYKKLMRNGRYI